MKARIIDITEKQFVKIKKMIDDKVDTNKKIQEGKFSEIKSSIRFVKPL